MWAYRVKVELIGGLTLVVGGGETPDPIALLRSLGVDDVPSLEDLRIGEDSVRYVWVNGWLTGFDPEEIASDVACQCMDRFGEMCDVPELSGWWIVQFEG